jgi:acetyl-CoA carboxylase carboxyltransferase component
LELVPAERKAGYDMHEVINLIADEGSVLELKPYYDGSLITALARLDGYAVGILANNISRSRSFQPP